MAAGKKSAPIKRTPEPSTDAYWEWVLSDEHLAHEMAKAWRRGRDVKYAVLVFYRMAEARKRIALLAQDDPNLVLEGYLQGLHDPLREVLGEGGYQRFCSDWERWSRDELPNQYSHCKICAACPSLFDSLTFDIGDLC